MIRLRILEILEEQGQTRHWLYNRMDMTNYKNFESIIENKTTSIKFETLAKFSLILEVSVGELFVHIDDKIQ